MRRLVAVLAVSVSVVGAHAQDDHLACFKVTDTQAKGKYVADIAGLGRESRCVVKLPAKMACFPTTKSNVTPTPPGGGATGTPNAFFCYKVKCPKTTLPTLAGEDQFGSRTVTPSAAKLVCAPVAGPTPTTTTIPFVHCPSENCNGDCVFVGGQYYVGLFAALDRDCSLHPCPECPFPTTTTTTVP